MKRGTVEASIIALLIGLLAEDKEIPGFEECTRLAGILIDVIVLQHAHSSESVLSDKAAYTMDWCGLGYRRRAAWVPSACPLRGRFIV